MRPNNGKQTKEITLILPESVEIVDIAYYWATANGQMTKTTLAILDDGAHGTRFNCVKFPDEG